MPMGVRSGVIGVGDGPQMVWSNDGFGPRCAIVSRPGHVSIAGGRVRILAHVQCFERTCPLPPDVTVCCLGGIGFLETTPGLTAVKGHDGTDAWHASTGDPSSLVQVN